MKLVYFGLDLGSAVLKALLEHGYDVAFVHYALEGESQESQLADLARHAGIESSAKRPKTDDLKAYSEQGIDLVFVNGYPHRLPIGGAPLKGVNMHPALLPEGRGPWPFPWTILRGLQQTGITTHKLIVEMDAGDILLQTAYPVAPTETLETLIAKYQIAAPRHALELMANFDNFWRNAVPQVGGSTWPDPTCRDRTLDWSWSTGQLTRTVRAFGSDGCHAVLEGAPLVVRSVTGWRETPRQPPGTVVAKTAPELVVATGDGYILLENYVYDPVQLVTDPAS